MNKFCVFCGEKPNDKTKEHILPQWLIEMTGNPTRSGYFGFSKNFETGAEHRNFSFKQFTFPACDVCNSNFSIREGKAQHILQDIMQGKEISGQHVSLFLDWLDKVRIGLWLGMLQLDKNYLNVAPKFHIGKRIGQADRLLIVEKSDGKVSRLNFGGVGVPSFDIAPSAFLLIVNNYYFTNISSQFLFSSRLGFPHFTNTYVPPDKDAIGGDFVQGSERIKRPLLRKNFAEKGIRIYQPIFSNGLVFGEGAQPLYSTDYIKQHAMDIKSGLGNIFIENGINFTEYRKNKNIDLQPDIIQKDKELRIRSAINISEWQDWLMEQIPSLEQLSPEQRKFVKSRLRMAKKINNIYIQHHKKLLSKFMKEEKLIQLSSLTKV